MLVSSRWYTYFFFVCFSRVFFFFLSSRSYRAPEVVLGLPYGAKIDVVSFKDYCMGVGVVNKVAPCADPLVLVLNRKYGGKRC